MTTPTQPNKLVLCELADASAYGVESFSPFCLKVHRALRAAGLSYERRHGKMPRSFVKENPLGQVPVLLVDGEPVADSTRILRRIERIAGPLGGETGEADAKTNAEAWLWEELADTALNGFLVAARWADDRNWATVRQAYWREAPAFVRVLIAPIVRRRVVSALVTRDVWRGGAEACWERFLHTLEDLEARAPRSGFWMGERLTVADVAIFGQLQSLRTPLTAWQSHAVGQKSALRGWLDRVDAATRAAAAQRQRPVGLVAAAAAA
ncbi:MAG: glutathione S-transferase family protein [Polyangiaceae bacterium]|jgi:glutathione S-transferase